ncbi:hypothetical protein DPX16_1521 [Anabarilius grahami]|uniref:Uncharacterized protein n=1 Tax=Anabarilius grahami TaxID=495550 RepID=A0A3N0Y0K3_ANAGA|nr:hypothetical protein DPX16_1521 [Anabarilius grahami]
MVFVKEESEEDMSEPEPWRIKHEEQGGLVKVKEEREDLMEVEEKHQHQKDHDVPGEESTLPPSGLHARRRRQRRRSINENGHIAYGAEAPA